MTLFERTVKMVLATSLSFLLAQFMSLNYASSAGIIAMLSIYDTKQSSLMVAKNRLISFIIAFSISTLIFTWLGQGILPFTIYLILVIPILYYLKCEAGIVPITVLVTHLMQAKEINLSVLLNECLIFCIGTGFALLFNSYMASNNKAIRDAHLTVENGLKNALFHLEDALLAQEAPLLEDSIIHLENQLSQALILVYRESDNHIFQETNYEVHYFEMRQKQVEILKQMVKSSQQLDGARRESILLAHLVHVTALQLSEKNSALTLIEDIEALLNTYRNGQLPQTRQEFETRAHLFQILQDLERFITEKTHFYHNYKNDKN